MKKKKSKSNSHTPTNVASSISETSTNQNKEHTTVTSPSAALSSNPPTPQKSASSSNSAATPSKNASRKPFITSLYQQLAQTARVANELPSEENFPYFQAHDSFAAASSQVSQHVLQLLDKLMSVVPLPSSSSESKPLTTLSDDDVRFSNVVDSTDRALEYVKLLTSSNDKIASNDIEMNTLGSDPKNKISLVPEKPQLAFPGVIDNSFRPWIPIIKEKPFAKTPLPHYDGIYAKYLKEGLHASSNSSTEISDNLEKDSSTWATANSKSNNPYASLFPHPYEDEIENLHYYPSLFQAAPPVPFRSLSEIKCHWIDTLEGLNSVIPKLQTVSEIAIDLEHHNFRSYFGFTCLMQISIRDEDFLVDTMALREHMHLLLPVFANPSIVKVLHGADSDIIWLQRDFGLYIVNLFDTGQAARVLKLSSFGLAFLLKEYCHVKTDKKYQTADWRTRPLSAEMLLYARMDTHYLLYVYDLLRNLLIAQSTDSPPPDESEIADSFSGLFSRRLPTITSHSPLPHLLVTVLERSRLISLKTYVKESVNPNYAKNLLAKNSVQFSPEQLRALTLLLFWRDEIARREDESPHYIVANVILINIATRLPKTTYELFGCSQRFIPPFIRKHAVQLLSLIGHARSNPTEEIEASLRALDIMYDTICLPAALKAPSTPFSLKSQSISSKTPTTSPSDANDSSEPETTTLSSDGAMATSIPTSIQSHVPTTPLPNASSYLYTPQSSPVLSTDQLYQSAGWIATAKGIATALFDKDRATANTPVSTSFTVTLTPNKPSLLLASESNEAKKKSNKNAHKMNEIMRSFQATIAGSFPPSFLKAAVSEETRADATSIIDSHEDPQVDSSDQDDDDEGEDRLRTPNTGEATQTFLSPPPMSVQSAPSPSSPTLPRTMREIYKISNKNRRRNKEKKRGKPSTLEGINEFKDDVDEDEKFSKSSKSTSTSSIKNTESSKAHGKSKSGSSTTSQEFLEKIGWIGERSKRTGLEIHENTDPNGATNSTHSAAPAAKRHRKNQDIESKDTPSSTEFKELAGFKPFDYSKATLPSAQATLGADHFNPSQRSNKANSRFRNKPRKGSMLSKNGSSRSFSANM